MCSKLSFLKRVLGFIRVSVHKETPPYYAFGIFTILCYFTPALFYGSQDELRWNASIYLKILSSLLCFGLIFIDYWPAKFREKYAPIYWYFVLWFCSSFISSYSLISDCHNTAWILNSLLSIFLLVILLDRISYFVITITSIAAALLVHYLLGDSSEIAKMSFKDIHYILYFYVFSALVSLLFKKESIGDAYGTLDIFNKINVRSSIASVSTMATAIDALNYVVGSIVEKTQVKKESLKVRETYLVPLNDTDYDTLVRWLPKNLSYHAKNATKLSSMLVFLLRNKNSQAPERLLSAQKVIKNIVNNIEDKSFINIFVKEDFVLNTIDKLEVIEIVLQILVEALCLSDSFSLDITIGNEANKIFIDCKRDNDHSASIQNKKNQVVDESAAINFCVLALEQVKGSFFCNKNEDGICENFVISL